MPFDDQSELFYLVDELDVPIGSVTRKAAHADRLKIHRAVDILVFDNDLLLMQKRSKFKDTNPGYWTISASGHVTWGQSYEEAAIRELSEELGLVLPVEYMGKYLLDLGNEQEYSAIFKAIYNKNQINIDNTEVEEIKWVNVKELNNFVETYPVTKSGKHVLSFVGLIK